MNNDELHRDMDASAMEKTEIMEENRRGGFKTMPFIFANECSEKLAVVGFSANMISYLTQQLHMPLVKAATTLTNFGGTAALMPLLGAFVADAYAGRFWTIAVSSIVYSMGMIILTVSAAVPQFRPPQCTATNERCEAAAPWQLDILYASLLLAAIGGGGIRPCVVAFGADQLGERDPAAAEKKTRTTTTTWNYFNWYYFCMGVSSLLAVTVLVYVQDNIGWGWGLGIPAAAMVASVVSFAAGYRLYRRVYPAGSPFTRLVQVVVAAVRKRKVAMVDDPRCLYENADMDASISLSGKLVHTKQFSFLDKAAIVVDDDVVALNRSSSAPNPWRLSTVHRVEELKSLLRLGPIWIAGVLVITAASQQNTFSLQQARTLDRRLFPGSAAGHRTHSFLVPPGSMTVFTILAMLATISLYDRAVIPLARRATGHRRAVPPLHRVCAGFAVSAVATLVSGFVEIRRKRAAQAQSLVPQAATATIPMSVFWLVPQYALHGVAEGLASVGQLEFFYEQAPESMRSTATALFWAAIAAGSYVSTLLVAAVHKYSGGGGNGSNWLPDNINEGRLENFYWLITGLQMLNLVYFAICVKMYTFKVVEFMKSGEEQINVEHGDEILSSPEDTNSGAPQTQKIMCHALSI